MIVNGLFMPRITDNLGLYLWQYGSSYACFSILLRCLCQSYNCNYQAQQLLEQQFTIPTDGTEPTEASLFTALQYLSVPDTTIKAKATGYSFSPSAIATAFYDFSGKCFYYSTTERRNFR